MRGDTLIQRHPPTPPTLVGDFQSGLHRVAQYNADRGYPYEEVSYGVPGVVGHEGIPSRTSHVGSHTGERVSLGMQYDSYGAPGYYHASQTDGRPDSQGVFSPPTPRSTNDDDYATRSSRSVRSKATASPPRRQDSPQAKLAPRARKAKATKGEKAKTPKLTAPLSMLSDALHQVPVKDMEAWVNRPADVRRKEAEKRNGYITRPMNSFMLYRSAYAERAKAWCLQNNHQVVSSVAGESWPLEPPEVRDRFNDYAKIERINHQNAHPTYKFSPSKTVAPPRKRKDEWSDEEPSDLDDAEWARSRQAKRFQRSISYPPNLAPPEYLERSYGPNANGMMRSSWEMTNEGRPMPMPMHHDMYNQYYQTAVFPNMHVGAHYSEDLRMRRVGVPGADPAPAQALQFSSNQLLGLPGGDASDLMNQLQAQVTTPFDEGQVDPLLLAYDGGHHSEVDPVALQQDYRNGYPNMMDEKYGQQEINRLLEIEHHHDSYNSSWQSDPTMSSFDQESEFDKWVGEH
ncbi:uncharacterized protein M421DRAFT_418248 [Didymella exigua CBS 183.55]|uniref:HMG box domain-containing protein n=1 Tax=Didymella exigua CBS 183.55 TaxID=1150837 RepID=A0A6A5RTS4_9PLEO|nr:uncharacterized protein M421DRAFT_418248 [Didymella exigua CBS 183.55]KAF1930770.1 hypothetical protein M421DRAFT_418248 [Didymella exigua CBS 183.55]